MSDSEQDVRTSLIIGAALNDAIECELNYGESKAEWIREACREKLND